MSTSITMIVPVKNTVPGVSNVFSAPGNTGQVLMAKPVHQQPEGDKSNETKAAGVATGLAFPTAALQRASKC
jgi:hypothetical protein